MTEELVEALSRSSGSNKPDKLPRGRLSWGVWWFFALTIRGTSLRR